METLNKIEWEVEPPYKDLYEGGTDLVNQINSLWGEVSKEKIEKYKKLNIEFWSERKDMITPQSLVDRGFVYHSAGRVSGADQWQGMAHWVNKEKDIHLRGNVSTAKGGTLCLWDYPRISVDNIEELDALIKLVKE